MPANLDEIIVDLAAERQALGAVLERLPPEAWDIPPPAPGWAVRDQVAHLAAFDDYAARIIQGEEDLSFPKIRTCYKP